MTNYIIFENYKHNGGITFHSFLKLWYIFYMKKSRHLCSFNVKREYTADTPNCSIYWDYKSLHQTTCNQPQTTCHT